MRILLECRQQIGEVLLRMGEVHLVEHHDERQVCKARALRAIERLEELRLVEASLERVEVPDQILSIPPPRLYLDERRTSPESACKRQWQTGLAGAADALEKVEATRGHPREEATDVRQRVIQLLARVRIESDSLLQLDAEVGQVIDLVQRGNSALQLIVLVHLAARGEGADTVRPADTLVDVLSKFLQGGLQQIPTALQGSLLIPKRFELRHRDRRTSRCRAAGQKLLRQAGAVGFPLFAGLLQFLQTVYGTRTGLRRQAILKCFVLFAERVKLPLDLFQRLVTQGAHGVFPLPELAVEVIPLPARLCQPRFEVADPCLGLLQGRTCPLGNPSFKGLTILAEDVFTNIELRTLLLQLRALPGQVGLHLPPVGIESLRGLRLLGLPQLAKRVNPSLARLFRLPPLRVPSGPLIGDGLSSLGHGLAQDLRLFLQEGQRFAPLLCKAGFGVERRDAQGILARPEILFRYLGGSLPFGDRGKLTVEVLAILRELNLRSSEDLLAVFQAPHPLSSCVAQGVSLPQLPSSPNQVDLRDCRNRCTRRHGDIGLRGDLYRLPVNRADRGGCECRCRDVLPTGRDRHRGRRGRGRSGRNRHNRLWDRRLRRSVLVLVLRHLLESSP